MQKAPQKAWSAFRGALYYDLLSLVDRNSIFCFCLGFFYRRIVIKISEVFCLFFDLLIVIGIQLNVTITFLPVPAGTSYQGWHFFRPINGSILPLMAASVRTFVVSWKDAADKKELVAREALVIPSSTCFPSATSLPSSASFSFISSKSRTQQVFPVRTRSHRCSRCVSSLTSDAR